MQTYESLSEYLSKGRCKFDRPYFGRGRPNTRIMRIPTEGEPHSIKILLHDTFIVSYYPNGEIILNSGNWRTMTTKGRMNEVLNPEYHIYQDKSIWYVSKGSWNDPNRLQSTFFDGFTISKDFGSRKAGAEEVRIKKYKKLIKKYCDKMALMMQKGKLGFPGGGDCWFCLMKEVKTGKPLGDVQGDNDHLIKHLEQGYIVPSLIDNALKEEDHCPMSEHKRQQTDFFWGMYAWEKQEIEKGNPPRDCWTQERAKSAVRRYFYRRLGIAY